MQSWTHDGGLTGGKGQVSETAYYASVRTQYEFFGTLVVTVAAYSSKYARCGRKCKSDIYLGLFCDVFVFYSEKSDWYGLVFGLF
jgi:hypothetical protein